MDRINMVKQPPDPEAYIQLRREGGMSGKAIEAATIGLKHSLFCVCLYDGDTLVGMGRIIGDGATFFQIVDIVVKPSYQGQGLAKRVMAELMNYLDHHTYTGSYVSLMADTPADQLYKKFGFNYTSPRSVGMAKMY
ncbi:GNAT family N-acetyltransferase [Amphibacillus sediminis]|uniref:GNAT family N-acetyltransferase n=1 Tax=Amphibacillus sediminis TaxID=360185 RepID=UPI0008303A6F|nr:GNAT family N-acetyltransferase [Amphibacillus sediminis]